jgi:predicted acyl esterase
MSYLLPKAGEAMPSDMMIERDVMVPMRDGVRLACDVYRPASAGKAIAGAFPVILERTPYGRGNTSRSEISRQQPEHPKSRQEVAAFFVPHGYVVVYQDCRGRYGSEGVFRKYLDEATDGPVATGLHLDIVYGWILPVVISRTLM